MSISYSTIQWERLYETPSKECVKRTRVDAGRLRHQLAVGYAPLTFFDVDFYLAVLEMVRDA